MKNLLFATLLAIACTALACSSAAPGIFAKKTQHEKYADKLSKSDLDATPEGRQWLSAAAASLQAPVAIQLPYQHSGIFQPDKPRALGLAFSAKRGEKITFQLDRNAADNFVIYSDLFQQGSTEHKLVLSGDTNASSFSFEIEATGSYILRLQPEIARTGSYKLAITTGPSLHFPVAGTRASIGSYWGADRDGGKRRHEGIDIFAPKRTPVVAATNGYVTGVKDGGIGGKTVWMRAEGKSISLYYAHLDQQLVREGQRVQRGDTIGLVGNTGNAKSTPPHLHFGIYTYNGAEDPLVFVNRKVNKPVSAPEKNLVNYLKVTKARQTAAGNQVAARTLLVPLAVSAKGYLAETPEGQHLIIGFNAVQVSKERVMIDTIQKDARYAVISK